MHSFTVLLEHTAYAFSSDDYFFGCICGNSTTSLGTVVRHKLSMASASMCMYFSSSFGPFRSISMRSGHLWTIFGPSRVCPEEKCWAQGSTKGRTRRPCWTCLLDTHPVPNNISTKALGHTAPQDLASQTGVDRRKLLCACCLLAKLGLPSCFNRLVDPVPRSHIIPPNP